MEGLSQNRFLNLFEAAPLLCFYCVSLCGTALTLLYEQINKIKVQQSSGLDVPSGLPNLYCLLCNLFFMQ